MSSPQNRIIRLVLSSLIASITFILVVVPVQAKLSCFGVTCRGKDPQVFGCAADARTLASNSSNAEIKVELRFSRKCNARWSRVTAIKPSRNLLSAWLGTSMLGLRNVEGHQIWSLMWTGPIKACGSSFDNPGPCTIAR